MKELACGLMAETDEVLESSPLLPLWAGTGAGTDGLS